MTTPEISGSGTPVYDVVKPEDFNPAFSNIENRNAVFQHIESKIGKIESILHEIVSDLVHINIYWIKPTQARPFHTLVTSGMSDKPMLVPKGMEEHQYAELCILLPAEWPVEELAAQKNEDTFDNEDSIWPLLWLKMIACFSPRI